MSRWRCCLCKRKRDFWSHENNLESRELKREEKHIETCFSHGSSLVHVRSRSFIDLLISMYRRGSTADLSGKHSSQIIGNTSL